MWHLLVDFAPNGLSIRRAQLSECKDSDYLLFLSRARARLRLSAPNVAFCYTFVALLYDLNSHRPYNSNPCVRKSSIKRDNRASSASTSAKINRNALIFASSRV
jgi:hypothetical protein